MACAVVFRNFILVGFDVTPVEVEQRLFFLSTDVYRFSHENRVIAARNNFYNFAIDISYRATNNWASTLSSVEIKILKATGFPRKREFFRNLCLILGKDVDAVSHRLCKKVCRGTFVPDAD